MDDDSKDYKVAYRKPPKKTQFTKGHSGNPRGRPKGSKNITTIVAKVARQFVTITERGRTRRVTRSEAYMLQLDNKALSGNFPALKHVIQLCRDCEDSGEQRPLGNPDTEKNDAVMRMLYKRFRSMDPQPEATEPQRGKTDDDTEG